MFSSNTSQVEGGYQISRSLRFNSADSAYLNRTPASAGNRKTYTFSGWVKVAGNPGNYLNFFLAQSGGTYAYLSFNNSNNIEFASTGDGSSLTTSAVYRDYSAWYHIVLAVDTTQATGSNRIKLYVNGSQITNFSNASYPSQNADTQFNTTLPHFIGSNATPGNFFIGYATEINFIDGQALTPSSFGETNAQTGVWQPKAYSGSYGTNGFYLNFSDNSNTTAATLGKDYSGNGNNWTPNNFSVSAGAGNDSLVDTPTPYGVDTGAGGEVRGNYPTWNPLKRFNFNVTLSNGNLDTSVTQTSSTEVAVANMALPTTGKWYWEVTLQTYTNASADVFLGVCTTANATQNTASTVTSGGGYYRGNGAIYNLSNSAQTSGGTWSQGDVIGIAVDVGAGTVQFYRNNVAQGATPSFSFTAGTELVPYIANDNSANAKVTNLNFGQRPFAYTAPSGFKALCTQNLPTPTIGATTATQAGQYFNPVLWTGNGSTQNITGVGFESDFIWMKNRSVGGRNHYLFDRLRGITNARLFSNLTDAENTSTTYINSTNSDGYQLAAGDAGSNGSGETYVGWNWKANGSGSTNTAGSITSTVSANTTSGFSVVTYTGNGTNGTVGHGLGVAPSMVIVKNRGTTGSWPVWHKGLTSGYYIYLNTTGAQTNTSADEFFGNATVTVDPSSTVVSLGGANDVNNTSNTYVMYCFAPIAGYSAFGSYTGNGSSDGPFVYCGFRPRLVMAKNTTNSGSWIVLDTARDPYNIASATLNWNSSGAESAFDSLDIVSNGFKMRNTNSGFNTNGDTYIFVAFAENPFKYSIAR